MESAPTSSTSCVLYGGTLLKTKVSTINNSTSKRSHAHIATKMRVYVVWIELVVMLVFTTFSGDIFTRISVSTFRLINMYEY